MNEMIAIAQGKLVPFDYSALPSDVADDARGAVQRIRIFGDTITENIAAVGQELLNLKERLGHGSFTPWIEAEFGWTPRTAENYMQVAERFGAKAKRVSYLPLRTLYQLASPSAPAPLVEQVLTRSETSEPMPRKAVEDALWSARQRAKEAAAEASLTEKQRRQREAAKSRRQRDDEEIRLKQEIAQERQKQAAEQAALLLAQNLSKDDISKFVKLVNTAWWSSVEAALKERIEAPSPPAPLPFKERRAGHPLSTTAVTAAADRAEVGRS